MGDALLRDIEALFHEAAELPPAARREFLDRRCGDAPALRDSVSRLLDALDAMGNFLEPASQSREGELLSDGAPQPVRIGRYEIVRRIGIGGMGIVYEARQESPSRRVAIKVIHPSLVTRPWLRRFEREAEILGRLHHPGLAVVHEAGRAEVEFPGRAPVVMPFMVMEFVEGFPLDEWTRQRSPDYRRRLEIFIRICDAVQHVHEHGIVHRDLKSSNILVDADDQPKVLDFGIAHAAGSEWKALTLATGASQLMGTIGYMSPEHLCDAPVETDARSDVYSLGVLLHELLCGHLPIETRHRSTLDAIRAVREDEPSRPGSWDVKLRGDIDAIVGTALRKEKSRRYATAADMAADVRRHLRNEPIRARPTGSLYQLGRFARRNKVVVAGIAATIAALTLGLAASLILSFREVHQRRLAETALAQATRAANRAGLGAATASLRALNPAAAAQALDEVPAEQRGWAWRHLRWRAGAHLAEIGPTRGGGTSVAFAPETSLLFVSDGDGEKGGNGLVRVFDLHTGSEVGTLATGARFIRAMAVDPVGELLLTNVSEASSSRKGGPSAGHAVLWHARTGRAMWRREGAFTLGRDAFSSDASHVAVGRWSGYEILMLDARTGATVQAISIPDETAHAPGFTPDGRRLIYSHAGSMCAVDRETGRNIRLNAGDHDRLELVGFVDDGRAVIGRSDLDLVLVDLETSERRALPGLRFASDPRGRILLSSAGGADGLPDRVLVSDHSGTTVRALGNGAILASFGERGRPIAWSRDGTRIATMIDDGTIRIWDAGTDTRALTIPTPPRRSNEAIALSPCGRFFATAGWGFVTLFELDSGRERWNAYTLDSRVGALAFAPDGSRLAAAMPRGELPSLTDGRGRAASGQESLVALLDVSSGAVERWLPAPPGIPVGIAWTTDGKGLLVATRDGALRLLDAASGERVIEMGRADEEYRCLALDARGGRAAIGGRYPAPPPFGDETGRAAGVVVWDITTGKRLNMLHLNGETVHGAAFDASGKSLAAVASTGEVALWSLPGGQRIGGWRQNIALHAVAFSPEGNRVAVGGNDATLRFGDGSGLLNNIVLDSGPTVVRSLFFANDGRALLVGGPGGIVALETGPPPGGFEPRVSNREARRVVDALYAKLILAEEVTRRLLADTSMDEGVRLAALDLARARGDHPGWLNSDAVASYRSKVLSQGARHFTLRAIELAHRLWPENSEYVASLGMCHYRAGHYRQALASLELAARLYRAAGEDPPVEILAFDAMAHERRGEREEARSAMRDLESWLIAHPERADGGVLGSIEEARSLVAGAR